MSNPVIQTSFNAGEWAPTLYARVDLAKYHSGAALLRNFYVDYRGGASARPGTRYVLQTRFTSNVRLIPFQASFTVSYILEFGQNYIRFYNNGSPVLEATTAISAINIGASSITDTGHGYSNGDWVFINNIVGTVGNQLNGNYYIVGVLDANNFKLSDLNGNVITFTGAYTSGGTAQRVYTIATSYASSELAQLKFAQNVNILVLCHPNHPPSQLTLITATNWTFAPITFGSTVGQPVGQSVSSTLAAGSVNYAYVITAVDANGQESAPSGFASLLGAQDLRSTPGTNSVLWSAVTGASSYNIYKAEPRYGAAVPAGAAFGFIGNVTGTVMVDSNITPDFTQGQPVVQNPFSGSGVQSVTVNSAGLYLSGGGSFTAPSVSFVGGGGTGAGATVTLQCGSVGIFASGSNYQIGDIINIAYGIRVQVTSLVGGNGIGSVAIVINRQISSGFSVVNPSGIVSTNSLFGFGAQFTTFWGVIAVPISTPGAGYATPPSVVFSTVAGAVAATATSVLGSAGFGNPTVPTFFQQRLVLAGPVASPQTFNMSQPGSYYNFNTTNPTQADNAIQATLVSGILNTIKSLIGMPTGLITLSDRQAWLINGGSPQAPISALSIVANSQAYNGSADPPPIVANDNILYVQSKGSIVRDLVFNFYTQVYTGTDISVLSSHLFYGFQINEWAWAEEPFKVVWAVRNDGQLLSLTFLKEQELIAWSHSDTQGTFESIATVTETVTSGSVDAIYTVVQRIINGNTVQYVERMAEQIYPTGTTDAWQVDAGLQFNGTATLTFSGAQHLAAATVIGLATDDLGNVTVITPFTMPTNGTFTLPAPTPIGSTGYTRVTIGLAFLPQLQTLPLDLGEPTVQGKRKKIAGVTLRVKDTLGLTMGRDTTTALPLQDLILGNVGSMTNQIVTGLVTGDVRGYMDPLWDVPGQYIIQQPLPYPATILGVIPEIIVGDTVK